MTNSTAVPNPTGGADGRRCAMQPALHDNRALPPDSPAPVRDRHAAFRMRAVAYQGCGLAAP